VAPGGSDQSERGGKLVFLQGQERQPTLAGPPRHDSQAKWGARAGLGASRECQGMRGCSGRPGTRACSQSGPWRGVGGSSLPSEPPEPACTSPLPSSASLVHRAVDAGQAAAELDKQNFILPFSPRACPRTVKHPHSLLGLGAPVCFGAWAEP